jgi:hypothetical protein
MVSHLDCDMRSGRLGFFDMLVHFVAEEPAKIPANRAMLEPQYHVVPRLEGGGDTQINPNSVLMVDANLRRMVRVEQIRLVLQELRR